MPRYNITAIVEQTVIRTVKLEIEADSQEEALALSEKALEEYPREISRDSNIYRMKSVQDRYEPPREISFQECREDKKFSV